MSKEQNKFVSPSSLSQNGNVVDPEVPTLSIFQRKSSEVLPLTFLLAAISTILEMDAVFQMATL